tara:strand:- start:669 stop:2300 length:1632 start_codon:yes stop_codon:yes gene_type:complete
LEDNDLADVVNLDALIPREDFITPTDVGGPPGESGKQTATVTDLSRGEAFFGTLRKPDFQRETAAWSPNMVCDFIESFLNGDLIPAVICWQSPARLSFIIDGAHRLSAIMAWIMNDYGAGEQSIKFYGKIPEEQERIHNKTRTLVEKRVQSYTKWRAEQQVPGSNPELSTVVRALAHSKVPLLWVNSSDYKKAERAFFTINQSAIQIDPTELKILNARSKPNAIAARAIVRNATGHKYWETFSPDGQLKTVETAKKINAALYKPPLQSPPRTEELPVAGHGYGTQTLPLIFDLVNIANDLPVEDPSKKKKQYLTPQGQSEINETETLSVISRAERLVRRITGTHSSSLGLHPAVYFYAANMRHQPTTVLAVAQLIAELEKSDGFFDFTKHRAVFEEFLIGHKMYLNQLTVKHGSMVKGYLHIKNYYQFVLDEIRDRKSFEQIEAALANDPRYQTLVKERPTPTKAAKAFSKDAKNVKLMNDVLETALKCNICGARIDKKAMQLDHITEKSAGGLGDIDNSQWAHPLCNSIKPKLQGSCLPIAK